MEWMDDKPPSNVNAPSVPTFADYPPNCPLAASVLAEGNAFRVTHSEQLSEADFQSKYEEGEEPRPNSSKTAHCRWRAVSIYREHSDARQHIRKWPYSPSFIAWGVLTNEMGKTMLTAPQDGTRQSHTEWWCADGIVRHKAFRIISSGDENVEDTQKQSFNL